MTRASLQAFRRRVTVEWPQAQAADAKALLVRTAKAGHEQLVREQTARGGVAPTFEAFANRPGRPVEQVILPGPIVYRYAYLREVVLAAIKALREASPVVSGLYRDSHTLFINGLPVDAVPPEFGPGDDIMIANPVPYARRLEIGKTESGRPFVVSVPDRIYERVAKRVLTPRYRNVAQITFSYATLPDAYIIKGRLSPTYGVRHPDSSKIIQRKRQQQRNIGKPVQAPAIVIRAAA